MSAEESTTHDAGRRVRANLLLAAPVLICVAAWLTAAITRHSLSTQFAFGVANSVFFYASLLSIVAAMAAAVRLALPNHERVWWEYLLVPVLLAAGVPGMLVLAIAFLHGS